VGNKSLKIALKNDRVERVEAMMLKMANAFNANLGEIRKGIKQMQDAQELFYETFMSRTLWGRFKGFIKWLGKR
jgi:hypothetical protein